MDQGPLGPTPDFAQQVQHALTFRPSLRTTLFGYLGWFLTGLWMAGSVYGVYLYHAGLALAVAGYHMSRWAVVVSELQMHYTQKDYQAWAARTFASGPQSGAGAWDPAANLKADIERAVKQQQQQKRG
jgi:hypothetical protein